MHRNGWGVNVGGPHCEVDYCPVKTRAVVSAVVRDTPAGLV